MHYALRSYKSMSATDKHVKFLRRNLIKIHHHQIYITLVKEIGKGNLRLKLFTTQTDPISNTRIYHFKTIILI